jgi:hypothetical protein
MLAHSDEEKQGLTIRLCRWQSVRWWLLDGIDETVISQTRPSGELLLKRQMAGVAIQSMKPTLVPLFAIAILLRWQQRFVDDNRDGGPERKPATQAKLPSKHPSDRGAIGGRALNAGGSGSEAVCSMPCMVIS